jgi:hypothetical protein
MSTRARQFDPTNPRPGGWLRFFIGLLILGAFFAFFASGYSPPGALGEVLRHNQTYDIDASPLFYTEVDNMRALEEGLIELREKALRRHDHVR